jgi:aryl-alcohol dehydrogenase-like predicted oxidoreductase
MKNLFPAGKKPIIIGTEIYSRLLSNSDDVGTALSLGAELNFLGVDSAECYGEMESVIGSFSKSWSHDFILSTKFGHYKSASGLEDSFSLKSVTNQLEASLENLQRDHIDIYYFHSGSNDQFLQPELWDFLKSKRETGVIRHIGLSLQHELVKNKDYVQVNRAHKYGVSVLQTVLNPLHKHSLDYVIEAAKNDGMAVVGRMPLSKGLIPKLSMEQLESLIGPNAKLKERIARHWREHDLDEIDLIVAIKIGLALSWCLRSVDAVVLAHSSLHQLRMIASVAEAIAPREE